MNEFKKRLSLKLGVFLILTITLLLIEVLIGRVVAQNRDDIIAKRANRQAQLDNTATLLNLRKDKVEVERAMSVLTNALPNRDGVFTFKSDVERFANNRNTKASVVFGNETLGGGSTASKIEFTVNVSGDFSQVTNFLKDLESSRYFTKFKNMELSSQGQETSYQLIVTGELLFRS